MQSIGQAGCVQQTTAWSGIPAELRERPQWCLAGPDKRPMTADGRAASATNPDTWADFDTACRSAAERGCGVGYVLTADDPFACIDMDVKDGTPPDALDRYRSIIDAFDSYTERSQSGRGWHVWVRGKIGRGRRRGGVEVYSQERFIICTGDVFRERPVAPRQPMLDNMVGSMEPPEPEVLLTGEDVPDLALAERAAADPGELGRLFRGDWQDRYPTASEADLALVKLLMPKTASPRECWATFRLSELGKREKDGRIKAARSDYMRRTLGQAAQHLANDAERVQHGREVAATLLRPDASAKPPPLPPSRAIRLLLDGELDRLPPLRWLVKGIIPDAGIGAIYGDSGTFKSFLTLDLLAHISNGREWFGQRVKAAPAVYVPFEGQGGIPNRVRAWRLAQTIQRNPDLLLALEPDADVRSNVAVVMDPLNLRDPGDRDALVATLIEQGWAGGVLCVDTLAHASNGIEENSSAMGEMIGIFRDLQQRLGGVILLVHHSGKDQTRGMRGWSGLHAAMDFVVECQKEGDGDTREAQFRLSKVKDGTTGTVFR
ncbi:MAG: AAA family ATPase, partial [Dehalococcoidia bacterium]